MDGAVGAVLLADEVPISPRRQSAECPTQCDVVLAADAQVQHRGQQNLRVPAGPTDSGKAQVRQHAVHGLNAGRRIGRGKERCLQRTTSTPTYRAFFLHVCASKTRGGSWGLRTYSITPGATRLSRRAARSLPQRLLAVQLPHSAAKSARCPQRPATTWCAAGLLPLRRASPFPLCL